MWLAGLIALGSMAVRCGPAPATDAGRVQAMDRMIKQYQPLLPRVPEVDVPELLRLQEAGPVVLVDVREDEERAVSTLPGAVSLHELRADPPGDGSVVVAYCTIGYRSASVVKDLRKEGLDARNLRGSILAWTHAGGELVGPDGPTRRVHVYGRQWDLAAEGYEAVW